MQVNPGSLDKKIEIIKYETQKDSDGFPENKEIVVLRTWAQVTNTSGAEIQRSNSDFSEVKTRFLMRTPKQKLDKDMFVRFGGNSYNIVYINDYFYDKNYTEIMTELVKK